jgi:hypothetical protein
LSWLLFSGSGGQGRLNVQVDIDLVADNRGRDFLAEPEIGAPDGGSG